MAETKDTLPAEEELSEAGKIMRMITEGKNPRGIPNAKFIENVPEFLTRVPIEPALGALNDLYSKYKYMETSFDKSRSVYKSKIPEISQSLELIEMMIAKRDAEEEMITQYSLCDTIFANAKVNTASGKVCLWMGASTMVEFTYEEAVGMLRAQLEQAEAKIAELNEDMQDLRSSSITVEVNMARLFNQNVKDKKVIAEKAAGASSS